MPKRTNPDNLAREIPRCLNLAFKYALSRDIEKSLGYWRRAHALGYRPVPKIAGEYRDLVGPRGDINGSPCPAGQNGTESAD